MGCAQWVFGYGFLLANNADIKIKNYGGTNVFLAAAYGGCLDIMKLLIKMDSKMLYSTDSSDYTPLMYAVSNEQENVVHWLVEQTKDRLYTDDFFKTKAAFWHAVDVGEFNIIKYLFEQTPQEKRKEMLGFVNGEGTVLDLAKSHGDAQIIQFLIENGADVAKNPEQDSSNDSKLLFYWAKYKLDMED